MGSDFHQHLVGSHSPQHDLTFLDGVRDAIHPDLNQQQLQHGKIHIREILLMVQKSGKLTNWYGKYPRPFFSGFHTSQVVQNFFHEQYVPFTQRCVHMIRTVGKMDIRSCIWANEQNQFRCRWLVAGNRQHLYLCLSFRITACFKCWYKYLFVIYIYFIYIYM